MTFEQISNDYMDTIEAMAPYEVGQLVDVYLKDLNVIIGTVMGSKKDEFLGWIVDVKIRTSDGMKVFKINEDKLSAHRGFYGRIECE